MFLRYTMNYRMLNHTFTFKADPPFAIRHAIENIVPRHKQVPANANAYLYSPPAFCIKAPAKGGPVKFANPTIENTMPMRMPALLKSVVIEERAAGKVPCTVAPNIPINVIIRFSYIMINSWWDFDVPYITAKTYNPTLVSMAFHEYSITMHIVDAGMITCNGPHHISAMRPGNMRPIAPTPFMIISRLIDSE